MKRGVYTITCTANNTMYIGQSKNVRERFAQHRCKLRREKHCNRHLQSAWARYGETAFVFALHTAESDANACDQLEEIVIAAARDSGTRLFNIRPAAATSKGVIFSEATKEKIRTKAKQQFATPAARAKHSMAYRKQSEPVRLLSPDGVLHEFLNPSEFAKEHDLSPSSLLKLLRDALHSYRGWTNPSHVPRPNGRRRLTPREKEEICLRYQNHESSTNLMRDFGVSRSCIIGLLKARNIPRKTASEVNMRRWHG